MKHIAISFLLLIIGLNLFAQNWQWSKGFGSIGYDGASSIATDVAGNIYLTGSFGANLIIDNDTLSNNGLTDFLLIKFDPQGNVIWTKNAGGANNDGGGTIAIDNAGYIYVAGSFYSPALTFDNYTIFNSGASDAFIGKFDTYGNTIWLKQAGGSYHDWIQELIVDEIGTIYLTGVFESPSINFGITTLLNSGSPFSEVFIVKLDSAGNEIWAKKAGGSNTDQPSSIYKDSFDNLYITGMFESINFTINSYSIPNSGDQDIFIVRMDTNGNIVWLKGFGNANDERPTCIIADNGGNLYLTGFFRSQSTFFDAFNLVNSSISYADGFLVKLDNSGNTIWAKSIGGTSDDGVFNIVIGPNDVIYITVDFESPVIMLDTILIYNFGNLDSFIAAFDSTGDVISITQI